uniref:Uncharacterized protein n=1 Tax=Glossina pallidipes TaxID=7398 RepID=A0A1A9Z6V9_GLOPL
MPNCSKRNIFLGSQLFSTYVAKSSSKGVQSPTVRATVEKSATSTVWSSLEMLPYSVWLPLSPRLVEDSLEEYKTVLHKCSCLGISAMFWNGMGSARSEACRSSALKTHVPALPTLHIELADLVLANPMLPLCASPLLYVNNALDNWIKTKIFPFHNADINGRCSLLGLSYVDLAKMPPAIVLTHRSLLGGKGCLPSRFPKLVHPNTDIKFYNPRNTHSVELYFRGEKTAKVMGSLAATKPEIEYTDMSMSVVTQRKSSN